MTRKAGLGPLLLAGLAAFGYYKYSKMTEQQKQDLKDKGKKFVDENLGGLKGVFGGRETETATNPNQYNGQSM